MISLNKHQQGGAALVIALIMLAVVIVLTVTNMREVSLEARMTAHRAESQQLQLAAESALREAERRYYGPGLIEEKLVANKNNCRKSNVYKPQIVRPCLIKLVDTNDTAVELAAHQSYQLDPIKKIKDRFNWTGAQTDTAGDNTFVPWMPYRGTVANQPSTLESRAYWNSVLIPHQGVNAEYGDTLQGKGTYFYLVTAQGKDIFALQSTIANIYLGVNN